MRVIIRFIILTFSLLVIFINAVSQSDMNNNNVSSGFETATFGSGCFWCSEAIFTRVNGVSEAISGYSGGTDPNPDYKMISSGATKYAEVVQITYNPEIISFEKLLEIFWNTHDPTTLNRQGADTGPQYRSVIFYHNDIQKKEAEFYKKQLDKAKIWKKPIVTEISPFIGFVKAEDHHQDFYENNPSYGYCNFVITPKIEKFEKVFKDQLKK